MLWKMRLTPNVPSAKPSSLGQGVGTQPPASAWLGWGFVVLRIHQSWLT